MNCKNNSQGEMKPLVVDREMSLRSALSYGAEKQMYGGWDDVLLKSLPQFGTSFEIPFWWIVTNVTHPETGFSWLGTC